ncbi:MAG: hypothetical protein AAGI45_11050 [Cyanobacteria bacterium P01_H01_bin.26]
MTSTDSVLTSTDTPIDIQTDNWLSVSDVAKLLDFNRGSLYNRIKATDGYEQFRALGISGDNNSILYPESAWRQLLDGIGVTLPEQPVEPAANTAQQPDATGTDTPVTPTEIQVFTGNHRNTLASPQFPTEFNLGSLRSELATVSAHDDPLALAEQFINGADSLMDAMSQDEKAMAQKIAQTRQARQAVGRKVDQLKRRNDIYALRTELLADRQNVETAALNDDFEVLQSMGKPEGA